MTTRSFVTAALIALLAMGGAACTEEPPTGPTCYPGALGGFILTGEVDTPGNATVYNATPGSCTGDPYPFTIVSVPDFNLTTHFLACSSTIPGYSTPSSPPSPLVGLASNYFQNVPSDWAFC